MEDHSYFKSFKKDCFECVDGGAITLCVFSVLGFFGAFGWGFDLLSHFRLQYFVCLVICVLLTMRRSKTKLAIWSIAACLNLILIAMLYLPAPKTHASANPTANPTANATANSNANVSAKRLRIMSTNLEAINNKHYSNAVDCVKTFNPDLIAIQEINAAFTKEFTEKLSEYKYGAILPGEGCQGVGLKSKLPMGAVTVDKMGNNFPVLSAVVSTEIGEVLLIVAHPLPPVDPSYWFQEKLFFDFVAEKARSSKYPTIVTGDFNASSWGHYCSNLKEKSGLADSTQGFGLQPTWPAQFFPLSIDIDHCFISKELFAVERKVGPDIHSDHKPLFVVLSRQGEELKP